jgi:hypothetical protein
VGRDRKDVSGIWGFIIELGRWCRQGWGEIIPGKDLALESATSKSQVSEDSQSRPAAEQPFWGSLSSAF